jgi:hypothetical protein
VPAGQPGDHDPEGKCDPFTPAGNGSSYRAKFTGKYERRVFDVGHNVPQEAP